MLPHPGTFLESGAVAETYLPRAQLVTALAQVRFPLAPELLDVDHLSQLRDRLKAQYPILREDKAVGFIAPGVALPEGFPAERIVRFNDKEETWQFSIGQNFMSLNTSRYSSRDDFFARLEDVMSVAAEVSSPIVYDRVGVRYISRFAGGDLDKVSGLINEQFLGLLSVDITPVQVVHTFNQTALRLHGADIGARWGLLPPKVLLDPSVPSVETPSWVLDVDVYQEQKADFSAREIVTRARRYADIAYRFFRLATTDELIDSSGSEHD
jgi:uncharacterized protein (TIGR04255 family)